MPDIAYKIIEFDIGSLLSNTLMMMVVCTFILYLIHTYIKYKRLYPQKPKGDVQKLRGDVREKQKEL